MVAITRDELVTRVIYSPETGDMHFRNKSRNKLIDTYDADGYIRPRINGKQYAAHRLAFLYMTGEFPKHHVDHINSIRDDNRWENLRDVPQDVNQKNMKSNKRNTSGICGVHWDKSRRKWFAQISANKKPTALGRYDNLLDACCARKSAEIKYNYHPNHGKR